MTVPPPFLRRATSKNSVKGTIVSLIQNTLGAMGSPVLVRVEAVHGGGVSLTGTVDVLPLVEMQDATGKPHSRERLHDVPYLRIQGGTSAVIVDPKPGDIGFIVISGRDHSNAIAARAPAPPASFRHYSMNDCVYVGGFLNEAPNQYVQFTDGGVRIVTPGKVEIEAQGDVAVTAGGKATVQASEMDVGCNLNVQGAITATGDVMAGSVSLQNHVHDKVQPGDGKSGKPQ